MIKVESLELGDDLRKMDSIIANNMYNLGTYATKSRALEVLDEIQKLDIGNNPNIETVCYSFNLLKVTYNMPKE